MANYVSSININVFKFIAYDIKKYILLGYQLQFLCKMSLLKVKKNAAKYKKWTGSNTLYIFCVVEHMLCMTTLSVIVIESKMCGVLALLNSPTIVVLLSTFIHKILD